ncbi:Uncharacterised protein [Achromobacter xylosoxidans]|nr:Uncharacterised protein [Achromobacter xylosoxidans]
MPARRLAPVDAMQRAVKLEAFNSWSAHSTRAMRIRSAPASSTPQARAHCAWIGASSGAVCNRQAASVRTSAPQPCAWRSGERCHNAVASSSLAAVNNGNNAASARWPRCRANNAARSSGNTGAGAPNAMAWSHCQRCPATASTEREPANATALSPR